MDGELGAAAHDAALETALQQADDADMDSSSGVKESALPICATEHEGKDLCTEYYEYHSRCCGVCRTKYIRYI